MIFEQRELLQFVNFIFRKHEQTRGQQKLIEVCIILRRWILILAGIRDGRRHSHGSYTSEIQGDSAEF